MSLPGREPAEYFSELELGPRVDVISRAIDNDRRHLFHSRALAFGDAHAGGIIGIRGAAPNETPPAAARSKRRP
jgi:hypothetical protein